MKRELVFIGDLRMDGRKFDEIREIKIETATVKEANGSALVSHGETKALAWINGPKEGRSKAFENKGTLKCIFSLASFSTIQRKVDYKRDLKMREFSKTLKDIFEQIIQLELYQRSEIIINVLVTQVDGSYKAAAINAVTLALINAGILMRDTVIGMTIGLVENNPLFDLALAEEKDNIPFFNVAYLPHKKKFAFLELLNAKTPYTQSETLMRAAENACELAFGVISNYLKNSYINN